MICFMYAELCFGYSLKVYPVSQTGLQHPGRHRKPYHLLDTHRHSLTETATPLALSYPLQPPKAERQIHTPGRLQCLTIDSRQVNNMHTLGRQTALKAATSCREHSVNVKAMISVLTMAEAAQTVPEPTQVLQGVTQAIAGPMLSQTGQW